MARALLLVVVLAASGCASSELRGLRNDLDRSTPGLTIHDGRSYSFGPMSLGLARLAVRLGGDGEDVEVARAILGSARRVQFAHYEVEGAFSASEVGLPDRVRRHIDDGWEPVLTVRDDADVVWLLANDRGGVVDEVFFVTLSADGLTLAKVRGDLTAVARIALREARLGDEDDDAGAAVESSETTADVGP